VGKGEIGNDKPVLKAFSIMSLNSKKRSGCCAPMEVKIPKKIIPAVLQTAKTDLAS